MNKKYWLGRPSRKEIIELNNPFSTLRSLFRIIVEPPKGSIEADMLTQSRIVQPVREAGLLSILENVWNAFSIYFHFGQYF